MPETEKERLNRKLSELLQELRVALPGIQVLFAFLLILPFTGPFQEVSSRLRDVYFASLICTALASALLIAPSAYHRLRWEVLEEETVAAKAQMMRTAGRLAVGGLVFLGIAMAGVVYFITELLFGLALAAILSALLTATFVGFWFVLPLARRAREEMKERRPRRKSR